MKATTERRILQLCVGLACLVPLLAGSAGAIEGAAMLRGGPSPPSGGLDSHFRYLSGLLLGIGLAFAWCIPRIEAEGRLFRTLGFIVVVGGLARLGGVIASGAPGTGHLLGLAMELGTVPLLMLWQARVARLCESPHAKS